MGIAMLAFTGPQTVSAQSGACYNNQIHRCTCDPGYCSQELCESQCYIWTDGCTSIPDCTGCDTSFTYAPATCDDGDGQDSTTEGGSGACYDMTTHACDCEINRCTQELCAANGGVWSSACSTHCEDDCTEPEDTTGNTDGDGGGLASPRAINPSRMLRETGLG